VKQNRAGGERQLIRSPGPNYRLSSGACESEFGDDLSRDAARLLLLLIVAPILAAVAVVATGCHPHVATAAERGAVIYRTNCIACHNANPNLPGSLGPAIAGSPPELIAARVMHGAYPVGYEPKRHTHIMRPLPWLGPHIGDLAAYLDSAKTDSN
jgi:mono/diheme cytochrome c family protein